MSQRILVIILIFLVSCNETKSYNKIQMDWQEISHQFNELPEGIHVYSGRNTRLPLNAWYVEIDNENTNLSNRIIVSNDDDRRETPSQFSQRMDAVIVINGGYFLTHTNPAVHVGLLKINDKLISGTIPSMLKREERYILTRSAIGFDVNGIMDIAWVSSRNDSLFEWKIPSPNKPNNPVKKLDYSNAEYWQMVDALQAGPIIIHNGNRKITVNEEVFFWSKISDVHPRTAAGYTKDGKYIFMVVDGRQAGSRGVDLIELSILMGDLNCEEAINLDGGGSSAIVVNGRLLNRPSNFNTEREVMSAIGVFSASNE